MAVQCKDIPDAEILDAIRARYRRETGKTPDELLAGKYPRKVILAKLRRMIARGILECGVSERTAGIAAEPPPPPTGAEMAEFYTKYIRRV